MPSERPTEHAAPPSAPTSAADPLGETLAPGAGGPAGDPAGDPTACPEELRNHPRYRIVRLIGRGGMGSVYQALHMVMDRPVALKVMRPDLTENSAAVERFRREVKAAAQLVHPNIVTAYDAEQVGDRHFLVMEYVEGHTLAEVVARDGPLPAAAAVEYVIQAAHGLQHAFERGMIHRDIKPHNLIVASGAWRVVRDERADGAASPSQAPSLTGRAAGTVKILDFGLARLTAEDATGNQTASGLILGTVDFMAPEQADNARTADIRSDIYALGCTLYYLLAGRVPFPDGSIIQRLMAHTEKPPPPLGELRPGLPPGLVAAVGRMLAKRPADRYQTPAEVVQALAPFLTTDSGAAPSPSPASLEPTTLELASELPLMDVIPVSPRPSAVRTRRERPGAAPPAPRTGRTVLGCFLLAAFAILSITGLLGYGIWLVVDRASTGMGKFLDGAMKQSVAWQQVSRDFKPPPADVDQDKLFPGKVGDFPRRGVNTRAEVPELNIDLKGRHAVYAKGDGELHLYVYQPVTRLEKEALFQRVLDVAAKGEKLDHNGTTSTSGTSKDDRVMINVDRTPPKGPAVRVRAQLWWSQNWLFVLRSPAEIDPEPLLTEYLEWLNKNREEK